MNEPNPDQVPERTEVPAAVAGAPVSASKRRLIRAGAAAVPVIATLTSRPAQAWHCQTTSAWGSEQINPNVSHAAGGHKIYTDETWTLYNWCNNTARSATGTSYKPWTKLATAYPSIAAQSSCKTNGTFDCKKVTVGHLRDHCSIVIPSGVGSSTLACSLMGGSSFGSYCVAAQLNHCLLGPLGGNNIDVCVTSADLKLMATLAYPPVTPWDQTKVVKYLHDNWMVRPS